MINLAEVTVVEIEYNANDQLYKLFVEPNTDVTWMSIVISVPAVNITNFACMKTYKGNSLGEYIKGLTQ